MTTAPESTIADVDTCKVTARLSLPCKREAIIPRAGLAALLASVLAIGCAPNARAADQPAPSSDVVRLVDAGNFAGAEKSIDQALRTSSLSPDERRSYEFERERMRRILLDFSLTPSDAQAR